MGQAWRNAVATIVFFHWQIGFALRWLFWHHVNSILYVTNNHYVTRIRRHVHPCSQDEIGFQVVCSFSLNFFRSVLFHQREYWKKRKNSLSLLWPVEPTQFQSKDLKDRYNSYMLLKAYQLGLLMLSRRNYHCLGIFGKREFL